ncbi:MAG: alkyldihydroxyacetonephosphate synthase [Thermoleophilaceae bacterium]|nr:alkyldihydroxyacetonephosphate synthase [Thermoleophilaceae bacterium]
MLWYGWGERPGGGGMPDHALAALRDELGLSGRSTPPVALEEVGLPHARLPGDVRAALAGVVGDGHVRDSREERVRHSAGRSYPDLIRLRSGDAAEAPDAIVYPASHEEVAELLELCAERRIAVVPFGGGTSVVGGVEPLREGFESLVCLDLERLDALSVDRTSLLATLGAGLRGPQAEARLEGRGLTLGHFPQSFEFATIGGYVATRSAGQASTGYGRIDELVTAVRCATPAGDLETKPVPGTAAGPRLRELIVGSEGTLGIITEATLAVRPLPRVRRYEGWSFRSFEDGAEALRRIEQAHASPDVARLSDEEETRLALTLASSGSAAEKAGMAYLRLRGHAGGCLAIVGWEGEADDVERRRSRTRGLLRAGGGLALGARPGQAWLRGRYNGPYQRDALLDHDVMVETLETATTWSNLTVLWRGVADALRTALRGRGTPPLGGCHVSHLYPSGASLYFTWLARRETGAEIDQWRTAKAAACDAIVALGGTITHHHAVGRDHAPWMTAEVGELGVEVLRAAKQRLDPAGIMNPGKLLPAE